MVFSQQLMLSMTVSLVLICLVNFLGDNIPEIPWLDSAQLCTFGLWQRLPCILTANFLEGWAFQVLRSCPQQNLVTVLGPWQTSTARWSHIDDSVPWTKDDWLVQLPFTWANQVTRSLVDLWTAGQSHSCFHLA